MYGTLASTMKRADDDPVWPALPYAEWQATLTTMHMWLQIVGKVKLELTPFLNDWWNVAFRVTARGLSTSTIPMGQRVFQVDFDFIDHRLIIAASDGGSSSMPLAPRTVADLDSERPTRMRTLLPALLAQLRDDLVSCAADAVPRRSRRR